MSQIQASAAPGIMVTQRLAKALAHPLRVQILAALHKNVASPNQLSQRLGEGLSQVSYHVKVLKEYECIELVDTKPRRGAVEHFYRATERAFFTDSDWRSLPPTAQEGISGAVIAMIGEDAAEALLAGTMDAREDSHLSRTPMIVDEQGWADLMSLLEETLGRVLEIQTQCAERLAAGDEEGVLTKVALMGFESPQAGEGRGHSEPKP